jgi:hypothetical protein
MKHSNFNETGHYNRLPDVLVADATLHGMGKLETLTPLCETILKYGLEDRIGIRLLHNHNQISQDEMMLEQEEIDKDGTYCLSTIATKKTDCENKPYANSWLLNKDFNSPLEYSLDRLVIADSDEIISREDFFNEFSQRLESLNASDLLGLCVLRRKFYEERMPVDAAEPQLIETTDVQRRANVLKFYPHHTFNPDNLIETVWVASRETADIESLATCTSTTSCSPRCYPTAVIHCERNDDGTHTSTTTNSHANSHDKLTTHDFTPDAVAEN